MAQKQMRVAPRQRATLGNSKATKASVPEYSEIARFGQEIDVVALIAARSGVASATVRAHCEAFRIGGAVR